MSGKFVMVLLKILSKFFIKLVSIYQYLVSPFLGECCRFYPSCSNYAKKAFTMFPFYKALMMSSKRGLKCQALFNGGIDDLEGGALHG